jgi:hypothetical protein
MVLSPIMACRKEACSIWGVLSDSSLYLSREIQLIALSASKFRHHRRGSVSIRSFQLTIGRVAIPENGKDDSECAGCR